ncbi:MAG: ABC transporter ATP-binding protein [Ectothiorhodospiraceae bacterium]|nr:ABC transporter ATP-binding protein [Ectothiorhodospiraceae bacterium]
MTSTRPQAPPILRVEALRGGYGAVRVLQGIDLEVRAGEVLGVLGRNGAGKTTTLKTVMGLLPATGGRIWLGDIELTSMPAHRIPGLGVGYVPQGRGLFRELSVADNLRMGMLVRASAPAVHERVLELFPVLRERLRQAAGTLSGGEQQMLAMARALCIEPALLLLDEPGEGLQPSLVARVVETVARLRDRGVAVVLVEQKVDAVLGVADRVVFVENGRTVHWSTPAELAADPEPLRRHVGLRRD